MKFRTDKDDIIKELQLLQGIVEKRNTMPGTDLEVGLKTKIPATIETPGSITVSGKKTFEIVRSLRENLEICFQVENKNTLLITSGSSEFKLVGLPEEDYPPVEVSAFEKGLVFPLSVLPLLRSNDTT